MVVDDEPLARDRLTRMLANVSDTKLVGQAGNGEEALSVAQKASPDLVFMDVRMPGMDGLAAAQHLAELEPPPAIIFVQHMMTMPWKHFLPRLWVISSSR